MEHFLIFISNNFHIVGWSGLLIAVIKVSWKASRYITKLEKSLEDTKGATDTINLLATNHLPHIQHAVESLQDTVENTREDLIVELKGLRQDLLQFALSNKK